MTPWSPSSASRPSYLDTALAGIAERYGSAEAYLEQALGVDTALRDRIGARLAA